MGYVKKINREYVDYDGILTNNDAQRIQAIIARSYSPSNLQNVLADANNDSTININDVVYVLNNLEG